MRRLFALLALGCASACGSAAPVRPPANAGGAGAAAPEMPPPAGFEWRDRKGDLALAARGDLDGDVEYTCEVWDLAQRKRLAVTTGNDVSAGGAEPTCYQLSPAGTLVQWGNGRNTVWKNRADQTTACRGVVAPDDSSCVEDDVTPFMFAGADGHGDDLELHWARPIVDGPQVLVATIPDGLDRNGPDEKWWTVRYCSPAVAEIDLRGGVRIVIDATTGAARKTQVAAGAAPCQ